MDTERGEGHVKIEAELGLMQPQAEACQEPTNAEGRKKDSSPEFWGAAWARPRWLRR